MKILKNIISIIIIPMMTFAPIRTSKNSLYTSSNSITRNQANVAVLVSSLNDPYIYLIKQNLENIEAKNESSVKFTFFDAKGNQAIQDETLDTLLRDDISLFLVNLVDTKANVVEDIIDKVKQKNKPLLLFNSEPLSITNKMKQYPKFALITTNPKEAGALQGKLIVDVWNKNKSIIDKNNDNIMQYIMLQGQINNVGTIERTKSCISTIEDAGIKTQQLALQSANWNQEVAKNAIETLFLKFSKGIEVIISNNDAMAIGAIEALQKYGYNKGDPTKSIPVFGIDGIAAAQDLISKGFMTGTVVEEPNDTAVALYTVGMNLINNIQPIEDTAYKLDDTGFIIRIPYRETLSINQ